MMTSRERVLCALKRGVPDKTPWIEIGFDADIAGKILGKRFVLPYGYNGQKVDEHRAPLPEASLGKFREELGQWIELSKKIGLDALGMYFWGPVFVEVKKTAPGTIMEGEGLLSSLEDLKKLTSDVLYPEDCNYDYAKVFIEETRRNGLASFLTVTFTLDVSVRGMGFSNFCLSLYDEKIELVEAVLDWHAEYTRRNLRAIGGLKPDFIWVAEDIAYKSGPFISPEMFRKIVLPRYRQVVKEIHCPWVFHSDGDLAPIMDDLLSLGMSAIHPIQSDCMDIFEVKRKYGDRIALVGNLDIDLLARGTIEQVAIEVEKLTSTLGGEGGYLLSSGNSIVNYLKPENVVLLGRRAI